MVGPKSRNIRFAIQLLAFGLLHSAQGAESPETPFLADLRERGLYELAERHCADRLLEPQLTEVERADLTVELLRTLAAHAGSRRRSERDKLWSKARSVAAEFSRKWPRHPRLVLVQYQDALTPLAQGEQGLREHEGGALQPDQFEPAHAALREAGDMLAMLDKDLALAIPLRRRTPPQPDELAADELKTLHDRVQFNLAQTSMCRALLFEPGSDDRLALLAQARQRLEQALMRPGGQPRLVQSMRLNLVECLRDMGRFEDAANVLGELEKGGDADMLMRTQAQRIHLALAQNNTDEVQRLLKTGPAGDGLPEFAFARLEARLKLAKDAPAASQAYDEAAKEMRRLDDSGSAYWARRAGQLLVIHLENAASIKNVELLARRADSLALSQKFDEAVAAYDAAAAAAQSAGNERAAFSLGYKASLVEQEHKQPVAAARRYRALGQDYADQPQAAAAHLQAVWHAGHIAKSESAATDAYAEILREHLATWPDSVTAPQARLWLARLAESRGQMQEALDAYAGIPGASPHFQPALDRLAELAKAQLDSGPVQEAYAKLLMGAEDPKLIARAREQWQLVSRRSPPGSPRWLRAEYSVALSHFKLGDKTAAAAVLRSALTEPSGVKGTEWEEKYKSLLKQCSP